MLVQLSNTPDVIFEECSPVFESGLSVVLWDLQTAGHLFLLLGCDCFELIDTYAEAVLDARVVSPEQMFQWNLIVEWDEVCLRIALQPDIDVLQSCIHVMEDYIVVEDQKIEDEQESIDDEHDQDTSEASTVRPVVIVVQLQYITSRFPGSEIHNRHHVRVTDGWQSPPHDQLGEQLREAKYESVRNPRDQYQYTEEESHAKRPTKHCQHLLEGIPVWVHYVNTIPLYVDISNGQESPLQHHILSSIMDVHSWPQREDDHEERCDQAPTIELAQA